MSELYDDVGHRHEPGRATRIVSLVPSLTEALAESGGRGVVAAATDWCTHPAGLDVTRIGGTKNPRIDQILALRPDLVVANVEENKPGDLDALRAAGIAVWTTYPRAVDDALDSLRRMLAACGLDDDPPWLRAARAAWAAPYDGTRRQAFVPIWRKPWMALGSDTFAGDVLARLGVDNVYADAADRYPRVSLEDARSRRPGLVVLPDEPYAFSPEGDLEAFAGWEADVAFVSGRHLTWYGPSLAEARDVLTAQLAAVLRPPRGEG